MFTVVTCEAACSRKALVDGQISLLVGYRSCYSFSITCVVLVVNRSVKSGGMLVIEAAMRSLQQLQGVNL